MKGTILDFLKLATEKPELTNELVELATKYDFEFSDEVSDEDLDTVAGGGDSFSDAASEADAAIDEAKDGAATSYDMWKAAIATLSDVQKRRAQNIQVITRI